MNTHLPVPKQVRELFADLLVRSVEVVPSAPVTPTPATPASVAVYVDDSLRVAAVIACDLELSARAGAAIGLVPTRFSEAAIARGELDDTLRDNLHEVLDVAASLFNVRGATHVRLHVLHPVGTPLPRAAQSAALTLGRREDLGLDIAGYGPGRMSLVLT